MLNAGAKADYATKDTKMTSAHWAAYNKDHAVMRVLLDGGADHFAFSHMFRLPIDVGGSSRAFEVVDACLDHYYEKICLAEDATFQPAAPVNSATALE